MFSLRNASGPQLRSRAAFMRVPFELFPKKYRSRPPSWSLSNCRSDNYQRVVMAMENRRRTLLATSRSSRSTGSGAIGGRVRLSSVERTSINAAVGTSRCCWASSAARSDRGGECEEFGEGVFELEEELAKCAFASSARSCCTSLSESSSRASSSR